MIENETRVVEAVGSISIMTIASNYLVSALEGMVIWLICMFAVIFCDLVAGVTHSLMKGLDVPLSKACRRTLGKGVVYFAVVATAVLLNIATQEEYHLDKWAVLGVAGIETSSIIGHILGMRGYTFSPLKLVKVMAKKKYEINSEEVEGIIKKDEDDKRTKK